MSSRAENNSSDEHLTDRRAMPVDLDTADAAAGSP